jgi:hypothetical protein
LWARRFDQRPPARHLDKLLQARAWILAAAVLASLWALDLTGCGTGAVEDETPAGWKTSDKRQYPNVYRNPGDSALVVRAGDQFYMNNIQNGAAWDLVRTPTGHDKGQTIFRFNSKEYSLESWGNYAIGVRGSATGFPNSYITTLSKLESWVDSDESSESEQIDQGNLNDGRAFGNTLLGSVVPCQYYFTWEGYGD